MKRKKLIEVSIPLEAINAASAREKSIRHGHPSTLHLWWARRPLAACRAVLFAQLVDDPSAWPERFDGEEAQEAERKRLHAIIDASWSKWENSNNETVLNRGALGDCALGCLGPRRGAAGARGRRGDPRLSASEGAAGLRPVLRRRVDPAGGAAAGLARLWLGPQPGRGADLARRWSRSRRNLPAGRRCIRGTISAQALSRRAGSRRGCALLRTVDARRGRAPHRASLSEGELPDGSEATVIAWLWARTVRSPDPRAKGAMVPLVSSFMLSTKEGKKAWVEPVIDPSCARWLALRGADRRAREGG